MRRQADQVIAVAAIAVKQDHGGIGRLPIGGGEHRAGKLGRHSRLDSLCLSAAK